MTKRLDSILPLRGAVAAAALLLFAACQTAVVPGDDEPAGPADGDLDGACLEGDTCTGDDLECVAETCQQKPEGPPAGDLGGACLEGDTCNGLLVCTDGTCQTPVVQPPGEGEKGGPCFGNGTCRDAVPALECKNEVCVEVPEGLGFGDACESAEQCPGNFCVQPAAGGTKLCSRVCNEDCPNGWDCRNLQAAGGDVAFVCIPPPGACKVCENADSCGGAPTYECLPVWEGNFCGFKCGQDGECPETYTCNAFGLPEERCVPAAACPLDAPPDDDLDGILNDVDNCPQTGNPGQEDRDGDQAGDACDLCPDKAACSDVANGGDHDSDGLPNCCDEDYTGPVLDRLRVNGGIAPLTGETYRVQIQFGGNPGGGPINGASNNVHIRQR